MPGKTNLAADAALRYLTLSSEMSSHCCDLTNESLLIASLRRSIANTWKEILEETLNEKLNSRVFRYIEEGRSLQHDESSSAYFKYDLCTWVMDLYKDRVFVPLSLRPRVLNN